MEGRRQALMQDTGLKRTTKDAYYTKPQIAERCVAVLRATVDIGAFDLVVEPAAGSGAFSRLFPDIEVRAYDIDPQGDDIREQDFLELDVNVFDLLNVLVVGNPPFGRQSSLAKRFVKRCCGFASVVAFVLPKSFKKPSQYAAFPLEFHKLYEEDLPSNSFTVNGRDHDVPCVFQIWKRMDHERVPEPVARPIGYAFVAKSQEPDFALRRVGVNAGRMSDSVEDKAEQSHYFIRLTSTAISRTEFAERYASLVFEHDNTVGPRSISKREFTKKMNEITVTS